MAKMNKHEIFTAFVSGKTSGSASNLEIVGNRLINYSTVIAERVGKHIRVNETKYSPTTSKNVTILKRYIPEGLYLRATHNDLN